MNLIVFFALLCTSCKVSHGGITVEEKMTEVFAWKQITYDFNGILYLNSSDIDLDPDKIQFLDGLNDAHKFFIQYNNVPVGFEVFEDKVFVTVPRRRNGIPSTLNYVQLSGSSSPSLRPYPNVASAPKLVSVYRPRVDVCGRLWMVDTGLLEVPNARKQIYTPTIVVYDLKNNTQILKYKLKKTDLLNEGTPGVLTSITVDVKANECDDAYAYITDLATNGLVVFSMKKRDSWRLQHESFMHDPAAMNFTVAGNVIDWQDGLFSLALTDASPSAIGRTAFYHPFVSTQEYSLNTFVLRNKATSIPLGQSTLLGSRGPLSQSGSHAFHGATKTLLFANVAQDAIQCWNIDTPLTATNVATIVQDPLKLVYISDLKVIGDDVWVLVNQMPTFIYFVLDPSASNFYIHRGRVQDLIRGTPCDVYKTKN